MEGARDFAIIAAAAATGVVLGGIAIYLGSKVPGINTVFQTAHLGFDKRG